MNFISDTLQILADTTWPSGKQAWSDFMSVLEYTTFFVVLIYLFDFLVSKGLLNLLNIF